MNAQHLESKFDVIGARLNVREIPSRWRQGDFTWINPRDYALDIRRDGDGEFFELRMPTHLSETVELTVLQCDPKQRHLLLLIRKLGESPQLDRFLCGHDGRGCFVAAVPGGASSVRQAFDALQPAEVRDALDRHAVPFRHRHERKNPAFVRQGEWFFMPEPTLVVDKQLVLGNQPLRRDRGKPHLVEQLYHAGGEAVHVSWRHPNGITEQEYRELVRQNPTAANDVRWQVMRRNPLVYARGAVRHRDHATIMLPVWHRVVVNTETQSLTLAHVAFPD